jgi:16S rRNA (adenine1518-N6/adenine1519-N6)-dimethyltransferase
MSHQTLTYLKRRFEEVGLRLQSRFGQNFLIDLNLLHIIVDSAELSPNDIVLEVGTGVGSLTQLVAPQVAEVVTVEIDPRVAQLASEELIDLPNITLIQQDALDGKNAMNDDVMSATNERLAAGASRKFKLVANLPYNIATPLISNLLALDRPPDLMVVTIQKEVADRLIARPGTKDYGPFSIWVQSQCDVELLRVMPPAVFWPRPKVDSAIVRIRFDRARRETVPDLHYFHSVVRALFLHRRKLLRGVLLSAFKSLSKPEVDSMLQQLEFGETARAEELDVTRMLALVEALRKRLPNIAEGRP